jgi:hypothetical protein
MTTPSDTESDPLPELRDLWLRRGEPPPAIDASALSRAAGRLRRRVLVRNLTEWGAAALLVPFCAHAVLRGERSLTRLGFLGIALAALYVSAALYRRGRVAQPPSASTEVYRRAHIAALERQAQLLESVWRWYLLPFVPGITLIHLDAALGALARSGAPATLIGLVTAASWLVTLLVFFGIAALNRRGARRLRREVAALGERAA